MPSAGTGGFCLSTMQITPHCAIGSIWFARFGRWAQFKCDEYNGLYHMQSVITANSDEGIPGELTDEAYEEGKKTGVSVTKLLRDKLADHATMVTMVSSNDNTSRYC